MNKKMTKKTATKKTATKKGSGYVLGTNYFMRGVTMYYTGTLVAVTEDEFVLRDAAWIADTGRFAEALRAGTFQEVEPYPDGLLVHVARGAILDVSEWRHPLPRAVK